MNTSKTEPDVAVQSKPSRLKGDMADALTLLRVIIAPLVIIALVLGWPDTGFAVIASVLFALGAMTDLLDDMIGGSEQAPRRTFGWFDDIADSLLIGGALLGLGYVLKTNGILAWTFWLPAALYIGRDLFIGVVKGYEFSKNGKPQSKLSTYKSAIAMLGISLMIAAPWLQQWMDKVLAGNDPQKLFEIYDNPSPWVWAIGQGIFWIAVVLSLVSAIRLLSHKPVATSKS